MSYPTEDPDDIFGFGDDSPVKKPVGKVASTVIKPVDDNTDKKPISPPAEEKNKDNFVPDSDDEDLFGFSPEKKPPPSLSDIVKSKSSSTSSKVFIKSQTSVSTEEDENKNISKGNITCVTGTFIGKGDITIKPEIKNEDGEELTKVMCKITLNSSLFRTTQPKRTYVPAPDPELLGRPTPNFKNFKKQIVGGPERKGLTLTRYVAPAEKSGVNDWIANHQDITQREERDEQRGKEAEDFWNFLNSQDTRSRSSGRGRR